MYARLPRVFYQILQNLQMVEINVSGHAIRVVLYQDGKLVAFETKKLDSTQCCYTIQENELVCSYVLEIFL